MWESCSYLGVDFHDEISQVYEKRISELYIPESCCLLNDVCYPLDNIDDKYKQPWEKIKYDEAFILKESTNIEETLDETCLDEKYFLNLDKTKFNANEIIDSLLQNKDDQEINFEEQPLDQVRKLALDDCPLLEELPLPDRLLEKKINFPSILELRQNLPIMEFTDPFEEENSFNVAELFKKIYPFEKVDLNLSKYYEEDEANVFSLEEKPLPKIQILFIQMKMKILIHHITV